MHGEVGARVLDQQVGRQIPRRRLAPGYGSVGFNPDTGGRILQQGAPDGRVTGIVTTGGSFGAGRFRQLVEVGQGGYGRTELGTRALYIDPAFHMSESPQGDPHHQERSDYGNEDQAFDT